MTDLGVAKANPSAWLARPGWRQSERRGRLSLKDGTLALRGRRPFMLRRLHDVELVRRRGNPRWAILYGLIPIIGVAAAGVLMPVDLRPYLWFSGPLVLVAAWLAVWSGWRTQRALWVRVRGTTPEGMALEAELLVEGMPATSARRTRDLAMQLEASCKR